MTTLPAVLGPGVATPPRRPGSVRRTSSLDVVWPGGWGTSMHLLGRARDLVTPADGGDPRIAAEDVLHAVASPSRTIEQIRSEPERDLDALVGARAGGRLRASLVDVVPEERRRGTPLYLLLDDLAGTSLVAGFAFTQWPELWPEQWRGDRERAFKGRKMAGVCIGFRAGSTALTDAGEARPVDNTRLVEPLPEPGDPAGWHVLPARTGLSMRRARRTDAWLQDGLIEVDAMFQDSCTTPSGGRVAVHEYQVRAWARPDTFELVRVSASPRVLPFDECPAAVATAGEMLGTPLPDLRDAVISRLHTTHGCTHLNDELRALAEVPVMLGHLGDPAGRSGPADWHAAP